MNDWKSPEEQRWSSVRGIVEEALQLPEGERTDFLRAKLPDADLRREAEQLLNLETQASGLFAVDAWKQMGLAAGWTEDELPDVVIGNYRLLKEIGRGGMGAVFLAERADGTYEQNVALKMLQGNLASPAMMERFRAERQILARLVHPGVARLLDGGLTPSGRPYLVMEYVEGRKIDDYCEEEHLDIAGRLRLFLKVAEVVQAAHQQLVLHLDIKPANILITNRGEPRLLDFGIARLLTESSETSVAQNSLVLMTPQYASPEQINGKPLGVGSDVFSLTTLLYCMLTGRMPYPIENARFAEASKHILESTPQLPSKAAAPRDAAALRGDLDTILLQGLRKEPERRYPTVAALSADIQRHLQWRPVHAHKDDVVYRARKFFVRNRTAVLVGAVATLAIAASVAVSIRSAVVARKQRAEAERRLQDVRALAHSYIFELDKMLIDVPGTIQVRHLILQNATKYLEAMSKESTDDETLARELAEGYIEIGRVQATPGLPSLSDPQAAAESQAKAIAIERTLLTKHPDALPDRIQVVRQLINLSQVYEFSDDLRRREELAKEAWEVGQPVVAAGPLTKRYLVVAGAAHMVARIHCGAGDDWTLADPAGALTWLDRSRELIERYRETHPQSQNDVSLNQALQLELSLRALSHWQLGDEAEAVKFFEAALRVPTPKDRGPGEDPRHKVIRVTYTAVSLQMGNVARAKELMAQPGKAFIHEKVPDRMVAGDEADDLLMLGHIDLREGRVKEGTRKVEMALQEGRRLFSEDKNNAIFHAGLAWSLLRAAEEQALPAQLRKSYYEQARDLAVQFAAKEPLALTTALVAGRAELGLAKMSRSRGGDAAAHAQGEAAAAHFNQILQARSQHPRAQALLKEAQMLVALSTPANR